MSMVTVEACSSEFLLALQTDDEFESQVADVESKFSDRIYRV